MRLWAFSFQLLVLCIFISAISLKGYAKWVAKVIKIAVPLGGISGSLRMIFHCSMLTFFMAFIFLGECIFLQFFGKADSDPRGGESCSMSYTKQLETQFKLEIEMDYETVEKEVFSSYFPKKTRFLWK